MDALYVRFDKRALNVDNKKSFGNGKSFRKEVICLYICIEADRDFHLSFDTIDFEIENSKIEIETEALTC